MEDWLPASGVGVVWVLCDGVGGSGRAEEAATVRMCRPHF